MEAIQAAGYTNNVVELMVATLRDLNKEEQRLLAVAATIGNEFLSDLLAKTCNVSEHVAGLCLGSSLRFVISFTHLHAVLIPFYRQGFLISTTETFVENILPEEKDKLQHEDMILVVSEEDILKSPKSSDVHASLWASTSLAPPPQAIRRLSQNFNQTIYETPPTPLSPLIPVMTSSQTVYRFGHDRVQQAASALLSSAEQSETHMKIAEVFSYFFEKYLCTCAC